MVIYVFNIIKNQIKIPVKIYIILERKHDVNACSKSQTHTHGSSDSLASSVKRRGDKVKETWCHRNIDWIRCREKERCSQDAISREAHRFLTLCSFGCCCYCCRRHCRRCICFYPYDSHISLRRTEDAIKIIIKLYHISCTFFHTDVVHTTHSTRCSALRFCPFAPFVCWFVCLFIFTSSLLLSCLSCHHSLTLFAVAANPTHSLDYTCNGFYPFRASHKTASAVHSKHSIANYAWLY